MHAMHYDLHTLKNGLRVVLIPMRDSKTATAIVMTGTGSRYENEKENGLAHFLEHMYFKGTTKRPNAKAISGELDGLGAISNAFTGKDRTAYFAKASSENIENVLDVIADIFLDSKLPTKEIEKERGAIIQEINMYEDMPMRNVDTLFEQLIFGADHPLGRQILGPKENINAFTRAQFVSYRARRYTPENTVVCVAGAFPEGKILSQIRRSFGALKRTPLNACEPFILSQQEPRIAIREKKTDQTHLMLGVPAYPFLHKDEYAQAVLATILGGGMSSRLFLEVREKRGLAYSVHAWADKYTDIGYLAVQAGIETEKLHKALETIIGVLRGMTKRDVSAEELKKAKSYLKGTLAISLESSDALAENAASALISIGRIRPLEETLKAIDKVTAADVRRVARDLFKTERLNLAIIGPHAETADLRALLKI